MYLISFSKYGQYNSVSKAKENTIFQLMDKDTKEKIFTDIDSKKEFTIKVNIKTKYVNKQITIKGYNKNTKVFYIREQYVQAYKVVKKAQKLLYTRHNLFKSYRQLLTTSSKLLENNQYNSYRDICNYELKNKLEVLENE